MNLAEYAEFIRPYARALRSVMLGFEFFVENIPGIEVHSTHSRIKTYERALVKSERLGISIGKMKWQPRRAIRRRPASRQRLKRRRGGVF